MREQQQTGVHVCVCVGGGGGLEGEGGIIASSSTGSSSSSSAAINSSSLNPAVVTANSGVAPTADLVGLSVALQQQQRQQALGKEPSHALWAAVSVRAQGAVFCRGFGVLF
jgi:hypothetical protein